jgi:hypothetical protein
LDFLPLLLGAAVNTPQEYFSGIAMTPLFLQKSLFSSRFSQVLAWRGATGGSIDRQNRRLKTFCKSSRRNRSHGELVMPKTPYHVPDPKRLRRIQGSFAWIDHRLLRNGFLAVMTTQEQSLYLFLTLAADRNGVSFYRQECISDLLGLDAQAFTVARDRLVELGLLLFDPYSVTSPNGFYQLLPVDHDAPDFTAQCVPIEQLVNAFTVKTK